MDIVTTQESENAAEIAEGATEKSPGQTEPETAAPKKKKGKPKKSRGGGSGPTTLGELAERYLAHLDEEGKSHGTLFSYAIELKTAQRELGAETLISSVTPQDVKLYFESAAVMKLKSGKPKAMPSYLKTQRVLRMALVWAEQQGWIDRAPIPDREEAK
jgi:hypothetical protein